LDVLFLGAAFEPEITALAPYNTDLCKYLVSRGHKVAAVVGFPNYPRWRRFDQYSGRIIAKENHAGVHVIRVPQYVPSEPTPIRRIAYDTSFAASAVAGGLSAGRPDLIIATCSPLQIGVTAAALAARWHRPFIFHVQDLLPEGAIALGMLRNRHAIAAANAMADFIYGRAERVTAIGRGLLRSLRLRGVPEEKLEYLPNWVDVRKIVPADRMSDWRVRHSITADKFLVMYIGNLGYKQDMSVVVDAAARISPRSGIEFVIVGDGSERTKIKRRIAELQVANVRLMPVQSGNDLAGMAAAADLFILHQTRQVIDMVVPSKLLTYASAGRPILLAGSPESEGARFVEESRAGLVVRPQDAAALADAILALRDEPETRAEMGANARRFVESRFARDKVLLDMETIMRLVAARPRA
jgi:colanic acid biosynthesis glycosyl transferase WcaI